MQASPTPAVIKAWEHYNTCPVCTCAASLTLGKIKHVIDHLPEEATLPELTDSHYVALLMLAFKQREYPFCHELDLDDLLGAVYMRGLSHEVARLLRQERASIRRKASQQQRRPTPRVR